MAEKATPSAQRVRRAVWDGSKRGLPKRCECGGKMLYQFDFGMVWSACDTCTPVVTMTIPRRRPKR